jgi:hypothetical protein
VRKQRSDVSEFRNDGYRLDPAVAHRDVRGRAKQDARAVLSGGMTARRIFCGREAVIFFARARHPRTQNLSVYIIRESFVYEDNEAIVKKAPLPSHKKRTPLARG